MTKIELEKEAEEYYEDETEGTFQICEDCYWFADAVQTAYVDSAEPREKRIAELQEELTEAKEIIKACLSIMYDENTDYELEEVTDKAEAFLKE